MAPIAAAILVAAAAATAASPSKVKQTEVALVDVIACKSSPQVARAINAMMKNKLIRYEANESGVYLFAPTVPLNLFGLPIRHIVGFDREIAFRGVPDTRMIGTAPPHFIQLDVAASSAELKKRAIAAGLTEAVPSQGKTGFAIEAGGHYLGGKSRSTISSIRCSD